MSKPKSERYLVSPSKRVGCHECDHVQAHLPQSGSVRRVMACGCEIKGNGLLESPWHVHQCLMHKTAPDLLAACEALSSMTESLASDWASLVADTDLPEKERLNRNQFYQHELAKVLNALGEATDNAQAAISKAKASV